MRRLSILLLLLCASAWAQHASQPGGTSVAATPTGLAASINTSTDTVTINAGSARIGSTPYDLLQGTAANPTGAGNVYFYVSSAGALTAGKGAGISSAGTLTNVTDGGNVLTPFWPASSIPVAVCTVASSNYGTCTDKRASLSGGVALDGSGNLSVGTSVPSSAPTGSMGAQAIYVGTIPLAAALPSGAITIHDWTKTALAPTSVGTLQPNLAINYSGPRANILTSTDLTTWTTALATVTANATLDPIGGHRTVRVQLTATTSLVYLNLILPSANKTVSVWAKSNTGSNQFADLRFQPDGTRIAATMTATWQRFTVSCSSGCSGAGSIQIRSNGDNTAADILVAMPELNLGASANTYEDTPYSAGMWNGTISQDGYQTIFGGLGYVSTPPQTAITIGGSWTYALVGKLWSTANAVLDFLGLDSPNQTSIYLGSQNTQSSLFGLTTEQNGYTFSGTLSVAQNSYECLTVTSSSGTLTLTNPRTGAATTMANLGGSSSPYVYYGGKSVVGPTPIYNVDNLNLIADAIWPSALTLAQQKQACAAMLSHAPPTQLQSTAPLVVIYGDSIGAGSHASPAAQNWGTMLMTGFYLGGAGYPGTEWYNSAESGSRCAANISHWMANTGYNQGPGTIVGWYPNASAKVLLLQGCGYNDLKNDATPLATLETRIQSLVATAQAAGYKVVIATVLQSDMAGSDDTNRIALNAWINAGTSGADAVANLAAISGMTYADTIHPDSAGQALEVPVWRPAIDSIVTLK